MPLNVETVSKGQDIYGFAGLFFTLFPCHAGSWRLSDIYRLFIPFLRFRFPRGVFTVAFIYRLAVRFHHTANGNFCINGFAVQYRLSGDSGFSSDYADYTWICLLASYPIYRVFTNRLYLTFLFGFCLFILKAGVLFAAHPILCGIMRIFVKLSRLCILMCDQRANAMET